MIECTVALDFYRDGRLRALACERAACEIGRAALDAAIDRGMDGYSGHDCSSK